MLQKSGCRLSVLLIIWANALCLPTFGQANANLNHVWSDCRLACQPTPFDDFFADPEEGAARLEKARQLSGVIEELEKARAHYLRTGNYLDLFPTIYSRITQAEMGAIFSNQMSHPLEKMDLMLRFYDSYQLNRSAFERTGVGGVEPHWRAYYERAVDANRWLDSTHAPQENLLDRAQDVLTAGIEAHVDYDLPRAIRQVTANSPTPNNDLLVDFVKTDGLFGAATEGASQDIAYGLFPGSKSAPWLIKVGNFIFGMERTVKNKRHQAWERGTGRGTLPTALPQKIYQHPSTSDKFLPEELKQRGLCAKLGIQQSHIIYTIHHTKMPACPTDEITLEAGGAISLGPLAGKVGPDGFVYPFYIGFNYSDMMQYRHGALVAFLVSGNNQFFLGQGSSWQATVRTAGTVLLIVNDAQYANNTGSFSATVEINGFRRFAFPAP